MASVNSSIRRHSRAVQRVYLSLRMAPACSRSPLRRQVPLSAIRRSPLAGTANYTGIPYLLRLAILCPQPRLRDNQPNCHM